MVVDNLPPPARAAQKKRDPSICNMRSPVDFTLEVKTQMVLARQIPA
jgi:hypothetical protein